MAIPWPPVAVEALILVACIMVIPEMCLALVEWLRKERKFPLWERIESAFGIVEFFSFGLLFGCGALCIELHRHEEARLFFAFACAFLAVRLIAWSHKALHGAWKWVCVVSIYVVVVSGTFYLLGMVDDAQKEWLSDASKREQEQYDRFMAEHKPKAVVHQPKPHRQIEEEDLTSASAESLDEMLKITIVELTNLAVPWVDFDNSMATANSRPGRGLSKEEVRRVRDKANRSIREEDVRMRSQSKKVVLKACALRDEVIKPHRLGTRAFQFGQDATNDKLFSKLRADKYGPRDIFEALHHLQKLQQSLEAVMPHVAAK